MPCRGGTAGVPLPFGQGAPGGAASALLAALHGFAEVHDSALLAVGMHLGRPVVLWGNRSAADLLRRDAGDLAGRPLDRLVRPADDGDWLNPLRRTATEVAAYSATGELRVFASADPVTTFDGQPLWVLTLHADDAAARLERERAASEIRFRALADRAPVGIFRSSAGVRVDYVNESVAATYGLPSDRLLGMAWLDSFPADRERDDRAAVIGCVEAVLSGRVSEAEVRVAQPGGGVRDVVLRLVPQAEWGMPASFVGTLHDVTEQRRLEHALRERADHDSLTGLLNRSAFFAALEELVAHRRASTTPALLFVDLDGFKAVNDSLGHDHGDELLREMACRLRAVSPAGSRVARLGGDEFVVLLPDGSEQEAQRLAERLLARLAEPVTLSAHRVTLSASIGIAVATTGTDVGDLLRSADLAMYRAKRVGKSRAVHYSTELRATADRELLLVQALREAIAREELTLAVQPVVRVEGTGEALGRQRLAGAEALARWQHPTFGDVPPATFVRLAEQAGLVRQLGLLVLRLTVRQMREWLDAAPRRTPPWTSVNVSPLEMVDSDYPDVVARLLSSAGLAPQRLCLEITESSLFADPTTALANLHRLRDLGVRLALDDFGTGHSSLAQLARLPVDAIKLDRAFVTGLNRPREQAVLRAVASLAADVGATVVAEGVEDVSELACLRGLGVHLFQGYLFGRPQPTADGPPRIGRAARIRGAVPAPRPSPESAALVAEPWYTG